MRSVRRTVRVAHQFAIAMVGGHESFAIQSKSFLQNLAHTIIDGFHGFDSGLHDSGMSDHIWVGEIKYHQVIILEPFHHFFGNFWGAHLRLKVIRRHLWRWHDYSIFARIRGLNSAIKKVSDVRILLGLRNAKLAFTGIAHDLSEYIFQGLRVERDRTLISLVVDGHCDVFDRRPLSAIKAGKI